MGWDLPVLLLNGVIFLVYGTICIISILFTFSIETYHKLDQALNMEVLFMKPSINSLLERNITTLHDWLIDHHFIVGVFLILLSLVDLKLWFTILNQF